MLKIISHVIELWTVVKYKAGLRLIVVAFSDGLMEVSFPDFIFLDINDLSKRKDLAKMVKRGKILRKLF